MLLSRLLHQSIVIGNIYLTDIRSKYFRIQNIRSKYFRIQNRHISTDYLYRIDFPIYAKKDADFVHLSISQTMSETVEGCPDLNNAILDTLTESINRDDIRFGVEKFIQETDFDKHEKKKEHFTSV